MKAALLAVLLVALSACGVADPNPVARGSSTPLDVARPVGRSACEGTVVFVPDARGENDYGLNAMALGGLRAAAQQLGMPLPGVCASPDAGGARLVIGQGSGLDDSFVVAARAHPDVSFGLIGAPSGETAGNLRRVTFDLSDGASQAGALAASHSHSHVVGFIGGKETDGARRLLEAYANGVQGMRVLNSFAGSDEDQASAKRIAQDQIAQGADVIFAAALPAGYGAIAGASQARVVSIGIERDMFDVAPNSVIASVVERTDAAAAQLLDDFAQGQFGGGTISDGEVTLTPARH